MIQKAGVSDLASLAHLLTKTAPRTAMQKLNTEEWLKRLFHELVIGHTFLIFGKTGEPEGFLSYERRDGFCLIHSLFVKPDARRRGIAASLLEEVGAEGREPLIYALQGEQAEAKEFLFRTGFLAVEDPWNDCLIREFMPQCLEAEELPHFHTRASLIHQLSRPDFLHLRAECAL